ncbi:MAG: methyl-accepting chemotaxis protein [Oscillospiraceae bacterium]|jgi:methyl-accepting chemotaxis protein|nr:methyl-accepting chemotaxis protein [Oscillospiraceae bacterium]
MKSLKLRLTRAVMIAFAVIIAVIFIIVFYVVNSALFANLRTELLLKGNANAANLNYTISDMVHTIDSFAFDLETSTDMSLATVSNAIDKKLDTLSSKSSITAFYVGLGEQNYLYETLGWIPAPEYVVKDRPWYQKAVGNRIPQVITYEDANTGIYAICVSKGITLDTGEDAVIAIDMEITSSLEANKMTADTEYFFVVDADDKIIFHRNSEYLPQNGKVTYLADALPAYKTLSLLPSGDVTEIRDYDGVAYYFAVNKVTNGGFSIYTGIESSTVSAQVIQFLIYGLGLAVVLMILAAVFFVSLYGKITKPIITMAQAAEKIAVGDMNVDITVRSKDEIGVLANSFTRMLAEVRAQEQAIQLIADGDYTVNLPVRSEQDIMNQAINTLVSNNNRMIGSIRDTSDHVTIGSRQISEGAQHLAESSTEQAAAVEQLSRSISEISEKTKENAELADKAAKLSNSVSLNAEKGSAQMGEMIKAVQAINEASNNIQKVIKVIDDIAFQTNILALNAAVEAARAGQQGKGFAVVAEEVRSLAAKSAAAASDTNSLIANSMEKAELGAKIAKETAESLTEIVDGINESSAIVGDIASSSDQQNQAISEINSGIDQVAQVVQQNSATAQESASISLELSERSSKLEELIAQFKLDGQAEQPPRLPGR